jgi:hypothetical protein
MIELTLADGRRCRLEARRDPASAESGLLPLTVHCTIDGQPTRAIALHAGWAETETLPPEVVDAIIRHFLLQ